MLRPHRLLPAFLFCLSLGLSAQTPSKDTSIGVWPWLVGHIDATTTEIINRARSTGLDTIYIHLWKTTGSGQGVLYIKDETGKLAIQGTTITPRVTLSTFIKQAHQAGIQVVGVIKVFKSGGPYPSDLKHQSYMIQKICRYLVHSYDAQGQPLYPLDGIALDYIRYFGGSHSPSLVNRFIDDLRQEIGPMPIHAYVIAGAYAVDGGTYDNNFRSYGNFTSYVSSNFGQHWEQLATRLECLMPMAYTASGHVYGTNLKLMEGYLRQVGSLARTAIRNAGSAGSGCRIAPAIRMWNTSTATTTPATIEASCRGALSGGADGVTGFRYFTARNQSSWFSSLQKYCAPGQDRPIARLSHSRGITTTLDSSGSFHSRHANSRLTLRYDLDGDGKFETGPLQPGRHRFQLPGSGPRIVSLLVTDPDGHRAVTRNRIDVPALLSPLTAKVSASQGGQAIFLLDPGPAHAGDDYIVFASLSGTTPGTPLFQFNVPLNLDNFTLAAYSAVNSSVFPRFAGKINVFGRAAPTFDLPKGTLSVFWVGARMFLAGVLIDGKTGIPRLATNPVQVQIVQ